MTSTEFALTLLVGALLLLLVGAVFRAMESDSANAEFQVAAIERADQAVLARSDANDHRLAPTLCPQSGCPLRARLLAGQDCRLSALADERPRR